MRKDLRERLHEILDVADYSDVASRVFDIFIVSLIVVNIIGVILESMEPIYSRFGGYLDLLKTVSIGIFSVEYILRVWVCCFHPSGLYKNPIIGRFRYVLSPLMIIDLIVILPYYLVSSLAIDFRILRLFRLLIFLRIINSSRSLQILIAVVRREWKTLLALFLVMGSLLLTSATCIYFIERNAQPEAFASIPHALWWAMATLTTVGYGDIVPVSAAGKVFGVFIMFIGIGSFAIPTGMLVSSFSQEIKRKDFVATWNLVAQVPSFSRLNAQEIAGIIDLLTLRTAMPGEIIIRKGELGDSMYFIVAGEIEVNLKPKPKRLRGGDFFGELALLYKTSRSATVSARTFVELLQLEARDFETLLESNQQLRNRITAEAEERRASGSSKDN